MLKVTSIVLLAVAPQLLFGEVADSWLSQDKLLHVCVSGALASTAYHAHRREYGGSQSGSYVFAAQLTFALGLAKEMKDDKFSYRDLVADCVGVALGILLARR